MSFLDDAISNLGQGLAQAAVATANYETGYNVGGALNALYGTGQTTGGQNLGALGGALQNTGLDTSLLNSVLGAVTQQTNLLQTLGGQLSSLAGQISAIQGEIANIDQLLKTIGQEQLYLSWEVKDQPVAALIAKVRSSHQSYGDFVANSSSTSSSLVTPFVNGIIGQNDISTATSVINDAILGQGGQSKGLLELWSNMVVPLVRNGTIDYREAVSQYMEYYKRLTYAQLQATNLVMEAYNYNSTPDPVLRPSAEAVDQWNTYREFLLTQEEPFIDALFPLIAAGSQLAPSFLMYHNQQGVCFTTAAACIDLNPEVQSSPPIEPNGTLSTGYYQPSRLLREAEQLLASLYVTEPQDRRIVVHMTYPKKYELVDSVTLTLGVNSLQPVSSSTTSPYVVTAVNDSNWIAPANEVYICLKRYVFSADSKNTELGDGTHILTNLNGVNGLVPVDRYYVNENNDYTTLEFPFMSDNIVKHRLTLSPSSPFDFMNFAAYTIPLPCLGLDIENSK
jgi:hypothetical protein